MSLSLIVMRLGRVWANPRCNLLRTSSAEPSTDYVLCRDKAMLCQIRSGGGLGVLLSKMFKGKLSGLEDLLHYLPKCTFAIALRNKCLSPAREGMWAAAGTWLPPARGYLQSPFMQAEEERWARCTGCCGRVTCACPKNGAVP